MAGWTNGEEFGNDWDDVSTEPPAPLTGILEGTITKAEPRPTKENKPAINLPIKIMGHFGGEEANPPRTCFCNVLLGKNFRVKQLCEAADVDLPTSSHIDEAERLCGDLVGKDVIFRGVLREWKGRTSTNVDRFLTHDQANEAAAAQEAQSDSPRRRSA